MPYQKRPDLIVVFLSQDRTGDISDPRAGLGKYHGPLKRGLLFLDTFGQRTGANAPLSIGVSPPSAGAGAWRIDHDEIGAAGEIGQNVTTDAAAGRGSHLNITRAGALKPRMDRRQATLVEIGGVDLATVVHRRGERQRLAASSGAQIDHLLAGFGVGQKRRELGALILDFDLAFKKNRLGMDCGTFGLSGKPKTQPDRRPTGRRSIEVLKLRQRLVSLGRLAY